MTIICTGDKGEDARISEQNSSEEENGQNDTDQREDDDSPLEFPIQKLLDVDHFVNRIDWIVCVKPGSNLNMCMKMAIRMAKAGVDRIDPHCKRFVDTVMVSCYSKILNHDAVSGWTSDVYKSIYFITKVLIDLALIKISNTDTLAPLDMLALALNPSSRIHLIPSAKQPPVLPTGGVGERQYTNTNVRTYLTDFINYFGEKEGFEKLQNRFVSPSAAPLTGLIVITLLRPFSHCADFLSPNVIEEYFVPIAVKVKSFLDESVQKPPAAKSNNGEKQQDKDQLKREDAIQIIRAMVTLLSKGRSQSVLISTLENYRLTLIANMLKKDLFNEKMNALIEINRLLAQVNFETDSNRCYFKSSPNRPNENMDAENLCKWIRENQLLETALQDCLHQQQYVEKLEMFLRFLVKQNYLRSEDLELIWAAQSGRHEAIGKNVYGMLAKLACDFSEEQLDFLFECFQRSWLGASGREREQLLSFIQHAVEEDKQERLAWKVLALLWNIVQDDKLSYEMAEKTLHTFTKILKSLTAREELVSASNARKEPCHSKIMWLHKLIRQLNSDNYRILALIQITNILDMFPEDSSSSLGTWPLPGNPHRSKVINFLHTEYNLLELVVNNITKYMKRAKALFKENPNCTPKTLFVERRYDHVSQLSVHVGFIRFVLRESDVLGFDLHFARRIWDELAIGAIFTIDRDICFEFFEQLVIDEFTMSRSDCCEFFESCLLKLDPQLYTENGMNCFQKFFTMYHMKSSDESPIELDGKFVGKDFLWTVVLKGDIGCVHKALEIFCDLYCSAQAPTSGDQLALAKSFLEECFTHLACCNVDIQFRVLALIRDYVLRCDAMYSGQRTKLPLNQAWRGQAVQVIARLVVRSNLSASSADIILEAHGNQGMRSIRQQILSELDPGASTRIQLTIDNEAVEDNRILSEFTKGSSELIINYSVSNQMLSRKQGPDLDSSPEFGSIDCSFHESSDDERNCFTTSMDESCLPSVLVSKSTWYRDLLVLAKDFVNESNCLSQESFRFLNALPPAVEVVMMIDDVLEECDRLQSIRPLSNFFSSSDSVVVAYYRYRVLLTRLLPAQDNEDKATRQLEIFLRRGGFSLILNSICHGGLIANGSMPIIWLELGIVVQIIKLVIIVLSEACSENLHYKLHLTGFLCDSFYTSIARTVNVDCNQLLDSADLESLHALRGFIEILALDDDERDEGTLCQKLIECLFSLMMIKPLIDFDEMLTQPTWKEFLFNILVKCSRDIVKDAAEQSIYILFYEVSKQCACGDKLIRLLDLLYTFITERSGVFGQSAGHLFTLACRILKLCADEGIMPTNLANMLSTEVAWLMDARKQFLNNKVQVIDQSLLESHLLLLTQIVRLQDPDKISLLTGRAGGPALLQTLILDFVFPASASLIDLQNFHEPICQTNSAVAAAFHLVTALCHRSLDNIKTCFEMLKTLFYKSVFDSNRMNVELELPGKASVTSASRSTEGFVGLKNAGATCYMNSVLQQLFMLRPLREAILCVNLPGTCIPEECPDDQDFSLTIPPARASAEKHNVEVFKQLQLLFGHLLSSRMQFYVPFSFWRTFQFYGEQVNVREQHDAVEFLQILVDNIDEALKENGFPPLFSKVIGGTFADQKICKTCPHRYSRDESFVFLNVDVQHARNLEESLEQYVRPELLEGPNAYHCERCNEKVSAVKRTYIRKAPDIMFIQLKRFAYDWERDIAVKYDDYFEFPRELDMSPYMLKKNVDVLSAPDQLDAVYSTPQYKLVGVTVHSGQANGGHYYSLILNSNEFGRPGRWYKFDDTDVKLCDMDDDSELQDLCFGGEYTSSEYSDLIYYKRPQQKWWSAYILIYERTGYAPQSIPSILASSCNEATRRTAINKKMPEWVSKVVKRHNVHHLHEKEQSSNEYYNFIRSIVQVNLPSKKDIRRLEFQLDDGQENLCHICAQIGHFFFCYFYAYRRKCNSSLPTVRIHPDVNDPETVLVRKLRSLLHDLLDMMTGYAIVSRKARVYITEEILLVRKNILCFLLECDCADIRSGFAKLCARSLERLTSRYLPATASKQHLDVKLLDVILSCLKDFASFQRKSVDYLSIFQDYSQLGYNYCQRLVFCNALQIFFTRAFEQWDLGPSPSYFPHSNLDVDPEVSSLLQLILFLVRCYDLSQYCKTVSSGPVPANPYAAFDRPIDIMSPYLHSLLLVKDSLLKASLQQGAVDPTCLATFVQFMCWENHSQSMMILSVLFHNLLETNNSPQETLFFKNEEPPSSLQSSSDFKPLKRCIDAVLAIEDSWSKVRTQDLVKGMTVNNHSMPGLLECLIPGKLPKCKRLYLTVKSFVHCMEKLNLTERDLTVQQKESLQAALKSLKSNLESCIDTHSKKVKEEFLWRLFADKFESIKATLESVSNFESVETVNRSNAESTTELQSDYDEFS